MLFFCVDHFLLIVVNAVITLALARTPRIGSAGTVRRQAVDMSPLRIALRCH